MATATKKTNLFTKAKSAAPAKTTKAKDEKFRITIKDDSFFDKVQKLEQLQDTLKSAKAKADMIADELRDLGKTEWAKLYQKTGKNPGSVMLENVKGEDTAQLMFIASDGYIKIDEARAESLKEEFGAEIVEEKTNFSFDAEMIEKYGEIISQLIEDCQEIDEDDKSKIIKATVAFSIAKGTIDKLKTYGNVDHLVESVKPIVSLKNVEVIKG